VTTGNQRARYRDWAESAGKGENPRKIDLLTVVALAVQAAVSFTMRGTAWPEVTTPAYLMSRGLLLYRDIKFVHTPGMMAVMALLWRIFPGELGLRAFMLLFPLLGHLGVLVATQRQPKANRVLASGFFLVFFYGWGGSAVWPTPVIAAMAVPLLLALEKEQYARAGAWLGLMIVCKQTAAYALVAVLIALLVGKKWRQAILVGCIAATPYALAGLLFATLGAGRDYIRWTLVVPFTILHTIVVLPSPLSTVMYPLALAFLPTLIFTICLRKIPWLLIVALGLSLVAIPRFAYVQLVGAVPCLALGSARMLAVLRTAPTYKFALACSALIVVSVGVRCAATFEWDGKITYWNEDPAFNRLVDRLRSMPPGPILSLIWPNLLPRVGRLPPADLHALPWLWDFPGIPDSIGGRVRKAASDKGCTIVSIGGSRCAGGQKYGPYCIQHGGDDWVAGVRWAGGL
jgi:hypothetical protein